MSSVFKRRISGLVLALFLFFSCNLLFLYHTSKIGFLPIFGSMVFLILFAFYPMGGKSSFRLKVLYGGCRQLIIGSIVWAAEVLFYIAVLCAGRFEGKLLLFNGIIAFLLLLLFIGGGFWRIVLTSHQAGILLRVVVFFTWWIPIINLFTVGTLCHKARLEYMVETEKIELNAVRAQNAVCKTNYPLLMVHGVFFRDWQYFNYWGRVPQELQRNGAVIFYGNQQSAAAIADSGAELCKQIETIIQENGCEKVNIIAHSKGGLDSRYAISKLGAAPYVASLTTVNTPHRGCIWAQKLLEKIPPSIVNFLASRYNSVFRKLGDKNPDFLRAAKCLTADFCTRLDAEMPDREGILYQSIMTRMTHALGGRFPLNVSYFPAKKHDGDNDGLVGVHSASHGNFLGTVDSRDRRGITHGDVIDLTRENLRGFDVREFYVQLVKGLKEKGL